MTTKRKKKAKRVLFTFWIDSETLDALRREKERTGATTSELARRALDAWTRRTP
jgi:hypothetical protein